MVILTLFSSALYTTAMQTENFFHEPYLNLNVRGLQQSATLRINEYSNRLIAEGKKVYKLGLGQSPFPVPEIVVQSLIAHAREKDYLPVKGLPALRSAISGFYERHWKKKYAEDTIVIGPGSKELLFLLQLCYYGELIIPIPSWVSYAPQARIIGRSIHWAATRKENLWRLTPEELDKICRSDPKKPRLLILNYPSNPTGYTYKDTELVTLAEVARRYKVIVVSDEIYGMLDHHGDHHSISTHYPEGTIISGGLSKWCGAGGWRLGALAFPKALGWLADAVAVAASETFTSTSAPIQYAAVTAFEPHAEMEDYLQRARRILGQLGRYCNRILNETGIENPDPQGGFYLFPDFSSYRSAFERRQIPDADALCRALLEQKGVAVLPGSEFGYPPSLFAFRLSYINFDGGKALAAASEETVDDRFIETYCPETLEAMRQIRDWIQER